MSRRMNHSINIAYSTGKNFGLSQTEFNNLCTTLKKGDNSLFEKIYLSHFKQCQNYLISNYALDFEESYDISMDTLIIFRKSLMSGKIVYGNLKYLFTRMAYYQLLKKRKSLNKLDKEEFLYFKKIGLEEQDFEQLKRINTLEEAIKKLSVEKQKFLEDHYQNKIKLVDMAKKTGEADGTLRKRKQRILDEIKRIIKTK